ncbi:MAG: cytochrome c [Piscinibacter sp.]|nr:cytochrome c [Piscinibacter sp.]
MRFVAPWLLLAAALPGAAVAGDAAAGRQKAQACAVCHGPLGIAVAPETPNLAGDPEGYLVRQLRAFRGGTRTHEVMSLMAKSLSDADIADLAAWFASLKVEVKNPP